jgi:hypothetical protein
VVCLNDSIHIPWQHLGSEGSRTSRWHPFCGQHYLQKGQMQYKYFITSLRSTLKFNPENIQVRSWMGILNRRLYYCVSRLQNWWEPWLSDNRTAAGEELPSGRSADQCQATALGVHTDPLPLSVVAPLLSACPCLQIHGLICKKRVSLVFIVSSSV